MATDFTPPRLQLAEHQRRVIVAHCYDGLPDEACGLLTGPIDADGVATGRINGAHPATNTDASAVSYTVEPRDLLRTMRLAEAQGDEIVGVWHSHTHTDAYPSATDVRQAVDPGWIYVIVTLRDDTPMLRAYRIVDEAIREVQVVIVPDPH